jgi:hypothetical protein
VDSESLKLNVIQGSDCKYWESQAIYENSKARLTLWLLASAILMMGKWHQCLSNAALEM